MAKHTRKAEVFALQMGLFELKVHFPLFAAGNLLSLKNRPRRILSMWYVMQVRTGTEESICCQCRNIISGEILERCFIPYYEEKKKYEGRWHTQEKVLFPGYVFMITDKIESLCDGLRRVIGLTKILGTGQEIVPLTADEEKWLLKIGGEGQRVEMSEGTIEAGKLRITDGPLAGMEKYIRRIDRHKRKACLEVELFGRTVEVQVGLEVVGKN